MPMFAVPLRQRQTISRLARVDGSIPGALAHLQTPDHESLASLRTSDLGSPVAQAFPQTEVPAASQTKDREYIPELREVGILVGFG